MPNNTRPASDADAGFPLYTTAQHKHMAASDADAGLAQRVMAELWPVLGGNHMEAETWNAISAAVERGLSRVGEVDEATIEREVLVAARRYMVAPSVSNFRFGDEYKDAQDDYRMVLARVDAAVAALTEQKV